MDEIKRSKWSRRWSLNPSTARARAAERIAGRQSDEGITLIEIVVAFTILMITMVPVGYLLTSAVASADNARQQQAALQMADSWLEILTNSTPPQTDGVVTTNSWTTPTAPTGAQVPVSKTTDGTIFTVQSEYSWQSVNNETGTSSDFCSDGEPPSPSHPAVIQLHVMVSWDSGAHAVTDTTNVDYPQPGLQTDGYISMQLTNSGSVDTDGNLAASRLEAIPVIITPAVGNPYSALYPDSNGCFFAELGTGDYTISLGQPSAGTPNVFTGYSGIPPFVTTGGSTSDSYGADVTVAAEQTIQLSGGNSFDEGINTSLSYGGGAAVDGGVQCPGTSDITCFTTGDGTSGASAAWGGTSSTWTSTTLSHVTHLNQVACTSASSPTCVGVGYTQSGGSDSGTVVTTPSDFNSISTDTLPSNSDVADITKVVCPSSNGCYALATTPAGNPVLLAGAVGQTPADTWIVVNPAEWSSAPPASTTFTSLSSIACPTSTTCELTGSAVFGTAPTAPVILRMDGDPATLASNPTWTPTFTADVVPSDMQSVGKITCPDSTQCLAIGTGDSTSPTDPTIFTAPIASGSGQASTWINDTFPANTGSVTGISCTSTTCVAIGTMSGSSATAAVWTGLLNGGGSDQWQQATTIPVVDSVTAVACGQPAGNDGADCEIAAVTSSTSGELIEGSLAQNGGWVWNPTTFTSDNAVEYYSGVACESPPSSNNSACAASAVTPSGPIIVTSASGPSGTWTTETPSSLPGATVTGVPVETTPASQSNWSTNVDYQPGGSSNATSLPGYLYPYADGYSVVAGDCGAEANATGAEATLSALPGGTAAGTVPLGLLPLQVRNSTGAALSGATVTLTADTSGCAGDQYVLPLTDSSGKSRIAVPYGTYLFTATAGSTTIPTSSGGTTVTITVDVAPSEVTVTTATTVTGPPHRRRQPR